MPDAKPSVSLPTELITEKTFYTLGGASAAVLLTCWAINYVAVDVSWMNYKMYRLLGIILSEACAIIIAYKTNKKDSMKWLFAFLNGLLIFVNASGLNIMTSSYIFSPKDSTAQQSGSYRQQRSDAGSNQLAGILPLPRMINWWPDEKLIKQNQELTEKNSALNSANFRLRTLLQTSSTDQSVWLVRQRDSLQSIIISLNGQLNDRQRQIDQLTSSSQGSSNELQRQLAECIRTRAAINDELRSLRASNANLTRDNRELQAGLNNCKSELARCNDEKNSLSSRISACTNELARCNREKGLLNNRITELNQQLLNARNSQTTLTELLRQVCQKTSGIAITRRTDAANRDDSLKQMVFYKNMNWSRFCGSFSAWYSRVRIE